MTGFLCIGCEKKKTERQRVFENTDWCKACVDRECKRTSKGFDANGIPNLRSEPPGYVLRPRR
jgi:hypothetical protein